MRPGAKMLMIESARSNEMRQGGYRNKMNEMRGNRNEGYGRGYGEGYDNEAEGNGMEMRRRRDRRGRYMEAENEMEMRSEMQDYRNEMRSESEAYPKPYLLPRKEPIGFHGRAEGKPQSHGHAEEQQSAELDHKTAMEWVSRMKNEDGSEGPHWSLEQVKPLMLQVKFSGNPLEFWAIMNAMYSDYCKMAHKYDVNTPEFFAEMAKAWLEDKDAVPNKASQYYECIVKH